MCLVFSRLCNLHRTVRFVFLFPWTGGYVVCSDYLSFVKLFVFYVRPLFFVRKKIVLNYIVTKIVQKYNFITDGGNLAKVGGFALQFNTFKNRTISLVLFCLLLRFGKFTTLSRREDIRLFEWPRGSFVGCDGAVAVDGSAGIAAAHCCSYCWWIGTVARWPVGFGWR